MRVIIYSAIIIFIILLIIVLIINKCKYFMSIDSTNIMGVNGKIIMDEKYEPKLNEVTTLKNVLNINKGLYTIYKSSFTQPNLKSGDIVEFGTNLNVVKISDAISFMQDNVNKTFKMVNNSDMFKYIKITYVPPILTGTDAICRFNMFINDEAVNMTSTIYRTGTSTSTITNMPIGIYVLKLIPQKENAMNIRITELSGSPSHLGFEGYIIFEEL